ncbi:electron transport complex subunit RsxA, partial [Vibrio parahaemolyticus]|nr:electron transport complex subunit RsxA [Vibrio parahaemolyticus]
MDIVNIIIANVFINNYVFSRFLGICPFLGVSNKMETATGMGIAVTFVTTLASVI